MSPLSMMFRESDGRETFDPAKAHLTRWYSSCIAASCCTQRKLPIKTPKMSVSYLRLHYETTNTEPHLIHKRHQPVAA
jgi:hypothetical protein